MKQDNDNWVYTGSILREQSEDIKNVSSKEVQEIIAALKEKANKGLNGQKAVGIAAPQIGVAKRIFLYRLPQKDKSGQLNYNIPWKIAINPSYIPISKQTIPMAEGCLSVPYFYSDKVPRYSEIQYKYTDENGSIHQGNASGFFAHIFQHETDHLNGKLYIDLINNTGDLKLVTDKPIR